MSKNTNNVKANQLIYEMDSLRVFKEGSRDLFNGYEENKKFLPTDQELESMNREELLKIAKRLRDVKAQSDKCLDYTLEFIKMLTKAVKLMKELLP